MDATPGDKLANEYVTPAVPHCTGVLTPPHGKKRQCVSRLKGRSSQGRGVESCALKDGLWGHALSEAHCTFVGKALALREAHVSNATPFGSDFGDKFGIETVPIDGCKKLIHV